MLFAATFGIVFSHSRMFFDAFLCEKIATFCVLFWWFLQLLGRFSGTLLSHVFAPRRTSDAYSRWKQLVAGRFLTQFPHNLGAIFGSALWRFFVLFWRLFVAFFVTFVGAFFARFSCFFDIFSLFLAVFLLLFWLIFRRFWGALLAPVCATSRNCTIVRGSPK